MKLLFKVFVILLVISLCIIPVALAKKSSKSKKTKEYKPTVINYQSDDRFNIVANLYIPPKLSKKKSVPLIILVHGIGQSKDVWKSYAIDFMGKGYSVLTIDLRGHGESYRNRYKIKKYWRNFVEEDWKHIESDVTNAIGVLKKEYLQVNTNNIMIIGADLGSNVSIIAASNMKDKTKGLVIISPYNNFKGIEARIPLVEFGSKPILIFVSEFDKLSYNSTQDLIKYAQGQHQITLVKKSGCGLALFKAEPKLKEVLNTWLEENFPVNEETISPSVLSNKKKKAKKKSH